MSYVETPYTNLDAVHPGDAMMVAAMFLVVIAMGALVRQLVIYWMGRAGPHK